MCVGMCVDAPRRDYLLRENSWVVQRLEGIPNPTVGQSKRRSMNDCILNDGSGKSITQDHGDKCYCGRPAKWHINYGSGCGHVCGIHKNVIGRLRGMGLTVRALEKSS